VVTRDAAGKRTFWLTPNVFELDGVRTHYVRVGDRILARLTVQKDPAAGAIAGLLTVDATRLGVAAIAAALVLLALFQARRSRRAWTVRIAGVTVASLLVASCTGGGTLGQVSGAVSWQPATTLYFHKGVGAGPTLVTDIAGAVFEERRYEPFGAAVDSYQAGASYPGIDYRRDPINSLNQPSDPDTSWSYHGARWLAPETGRWLTPDPPVTKPDAKFMAEPWALHPYQYVKQNPVLYWDPDGNADAFIDDVATEVWFDGFAFQVRWEHEGRSGWIEVGQKSVVDHPGGGKVHTNFMETNADGIQVPESYSPVFTPRLWHGMQAIRLDQGADFDEQGAMYTGMLCIAMAWIMAPSRGSVPIIQQTTQSSVKLGIDVEIGFAKPWSTMTKAEQGAFQHAYSRHAQELGLPAWQGSRAEALRVQFNNVTGYIRNNAQRVFQVNKPLGIRGGGVPAHSAVVRFYVHTDSKGNQFYYYETIGGRFISAGKNMAKGAAK
jgi:RHS repeat-associated protein